MSGLMPAVAQAAPSPSLYFEKASLTAANGSNVSLPLHVNGNGSTVNAINVVVSYPDDQLTFVGVDKAGTYFDTVVPATPKAAQGKVNFSVASFNKAADSDVLVATLIFTAKAQTGTAKISLAGSQVANGGSAMAVDDSGATITLVASNDTSATTLAITDISATDLTTSSGTIRWHTAVPASSSVDYGATDSYGFSASSDGLTTDHVVQLADAFSGKTTVHFKITSLAANGQSGFSSDRSFITLGYTVDIVVKDKSGAAIKDAEVHIGDRTAVKTNSQGIARLENVAGGNQKVYINDNAPQIITVKEVNGKAGATPQRFNLVAQRSSALGPNALLALLFIVLAAVLYWAWRKRSVQIS